MDPPYHLQPPLVSLSWSASTSAVMLLDGDLSDGCTHARFSRWRLEPPVPESTQHQTWWEHTLYCIYTQLTQLWSPMPIDYSRPYWHWLSVASKFITSIKITLSLSLYLAAGSTTSSTLITTVMLEAQGIMLLLSSIVKPKWAIASTFKS